MVSHQGVVVVVVVFSQGDPRKKKKKEEEEKKASDRCTDELFLTLSQPRGLQVWGKVWTTVSIQHNQDTPVSNDKV